MEDNNRVSPTAGLVARLRAPEQWRSFPDMDDDAPREAATELERLAFALRVIANLPVSEQDNLMAANMRKIAREALQ